MNKNYHKFWKKVNTQIRYKQTAVVDPEIPNIKEITNGSSNNAFNKLIIQRKQTILRSFFGLI